MTQFQAFACSRGLSVFATDADSQRRSVMCAGTVLRGNLKIGEGLHAQLDDTLATISFTSLRSRLSPVSAYCVVVAVHDGTRTAVVAASRLAIGRL